MNGKVETEREIRARIEELDTISNIISQDPWSWSSIIRMRKEELQKILEENLKE